MAGVALIHLSRALYLVVVDQVVGLGKIHTEGTGIGGDEQSAVGVLLELGLGSRLLPRAHVAVVDHRLVVRQGVLQHVAHVLEEGEDDDLVLRVGVQDVGDVLHHRKGLLGLAQVVQPSGLGQFGGVL